MNPNDSPTNSGGITGLHSPVLSATTLPPEPLAGNIRSQWMLDPTIDFLNHGCFGARPKPVHAAQCRWREEYETAPVNLLDRRRDELVDHAKSAVGRFIHAQPSDFGFVTNVTTAVCCVLRSLDLQPGDELLTTDHAYNAVRLTMNHLAARAGAVVRELAVPVPIQSPQQVVEIFASALSQRTRLVVIDHVTSPTAILFPVQDIVNLCDEAGVDVLVDGAHAPGMLDLNVEQLGAAYYTGNLHKWVCAPSGCAFLWVRPDRQQGIYPCTLSHFFDQGLAEAFSWQGTRDITPWLTAPAAIEYFDTFGWERVRKHNHQMALWVQAMLAQQWGVIPSTPLDGSMLGSMATIELPPGICRYESPQALHDVLYDEHRIESPILDWNGRWWTRPCCHIYNTPDQYERLAQVVLKLATNTSSSSVK